MSTYIPPPSRTRSLRNPSLSRPERPSNIETKESSATRPSAELKDGSDRGAKSPSRLPITRNSSSLHRTASLSSSTSRDSSMPPPPPRVSSKPIGRPEPSRPPVTRSAVTDSERRSLQLQSSTSRQTRAGSVSSSTESNTSRQRSIPTSIHNRTASSSTNKSTEKISLQRGNASGHRRNASAIVSQSTGIEPPQRSNVSKATRPLSMSASPYPEKGSLQQLQQQPSTRQTRSSTLSTTGPPNARVGAHTRSSSILLNDSTILKPPIPSPALLDPKRPVFSTLQQHFSPNKNLGPKPQTASYLAPPSPSKLPENKLISAETAKLQSELLQLHLLHRNSAVAQKEWQDSARHKIGKKFEGIAERHRRLVTLESQEQIHTNALALKTWADVENAAWGIEEMSIGLGEVITGVWNLSEPGGKYGKVVRRFEKWCVRVQSIMEARKNKTEGNTMQFIEELDETWDRERETLIRKLEGFKDQLDGLGVFKGDGSSLVQVVDGYRELTEGMLMELDVIKKMEQEVLLREEEWIRESIDTVSDGDEDIRGGAWRRW